MGKITEYSQVSSLLGADVFLKDGTAGTKIISANNLMSGLLGLMSSDDLFARLDEIASPELHRMLYRGKYLGTSLTTAQKNQISAGTFHGLWLGDYWTISGVNYQIVDFDYWYNCGDTSFTSHHIVVMPMAVMYNAQMNTTNTTDGGYYGSAMRGGANYPSGGNLAQAYTAFSAAFGTALLTHREYIDNAVTNGEASGGAWFDSTVDLPNEIMIYGSHIFKPADDGTTVVNRYTISNSQLALMQARPRAIKIRANYWLRDEVSASHFAYVGGYGHAYYNDASASRGVRPVAAVG